MITVMTRFSARGADLLLVAQGNPQGACYGRALFLTYTSEWICFLLLERYYSCYYPESEEFRERVASIVNYFRENGYNVIMDRMVSEEITSQGPTRWGENQIRKAKKVLIFLSPGLVNLAMDSREDSQCQV